jgi:hypothetical protein
MRTVSTWMGLAAVAGLLIGTPAIAKTAKGGTPKVTCKQINAAKAGGKSDEDVATELNVTPERIKSCGTHSATAKHHTATKKPGS